MQYEYINLLKNNLSKKNHFLIIKLFFSKKNDKVSNNSGYSKLPKKLFFTKYKHYLMENIFNHHCPILLLPD